MHHVVDNRYFIELELLRTDSGTVCKAKDLTLHREVLVYMLNPALWTGTEQAKNTISKITAYSDARFMHILDGSTDGRQTYLVLKSDDGEPLTSTLGRAAVTPDQAVAIAMQVGACIQDALESEISGFAVTADNIWMSELGRPLVIDTWSPASPHRRGVAGLCRLLLQALLNRTIVPSEPVTLEADIRAAVADWPAERQEALVGAVRAVRRGQETLSSFVLQLRDLSTSAGLHPSPPVNRPEPAVIASPQAEDEQIEIYEESGRTESVNVMPAFLRKHRKWLIGASTSVAVLVALIIWFVSNMEVDRQEALSDGAAVSGNPSEKRTEPSTSPRPSGTASPSPSASTSTGSGTGNATVQPVSAVPNFVGLSKEEAEKRALSGALHYQYYIENNPGPPNTVFKQNPEAGTKADGSVRVTFWVSKGN